MQDTDPYRHHPGLRGKISDPDASFFRNFRPADLDERMAAMGRPADWRLPDEVREADRAATLHGHDGDLWVFAYGSLMWDPAFHFTEIRRAWVPSHTRRFILKDMFGARGSPDRPGAMAALDEGPGCHGLVLRIAADEVDAETRILWNRERLGAAYVPAFVPAETALGPVTALTFVADHTSEFIFPNLSHDEQVQYIATGTGLLGSSFDYVQTLVDHFRILGIEDADLERLFRDANAYRET